VSDDLESFKSIVHASTLSIVVVMLTVDTIRPGKHRRVEKTTLSYAVQFWILCLLAVQQISLTPKLSIINELSGDGGI
jgi:hypothetical protein